jgi:hypothetical protein
VYAHFFFSRSVSLYRVQNDEITKAQCVERDKSLGTRLNRQLDCWKRMKKRAMDGNAKRFLFFFASTLCSQHTNRTFVL